MQSLFAIQQNRLVLYVIRIRNTAIHWTHRSALWLLMKSRTLRALVWNNKIYLLTHGRELIVHVYQTPLGQEKHPYRLQLPTLPPLHKSHC
jgi:hypothetical protein